VPIFIQVDTHLDEEMTRKHAGIDVGLIGVGETRYTPRYNRIRNADRGDKGRGSRSRSVSRTVPRRERGAVALVGTLVSVGAERKGFLNKLINICAAVITSEAPGRAAY